MTAVAVMSRTPREPEIDLTPPPVPPCWPDLFGRMEVGNALLVDRIHEGALRAAMTREHRRSDKRFTARVVDGLTVRCWRLA